jgi:hypothetical protein
MSEAYWLEKAALPPKYQSMPSNDLRISCEGAARQPPRRPLLESYGVAAARAKRALVSCMRWLGGGERSYCGRVQKPSATPSQFRRTNSQATPRLMNSSSNSDDQ